jgi:RHS repeat-associated protein
VGEGLPLLLQDGTTQYAYGPGGLPLEQVSGSTVLYYHQDQLGSTRALTNSTGTVVATYGYDAYGNVTGKTGSVTNPFQYAGQYTDAESGLEYLRARYYDAAIGQFLTRDPLIGLTQQAYGYTKGDPLNVIDPSGSDSISNFTDLAGLVLGYAIVLAGESAVAALRTTEAQRDACAWQNSCGFNMHACSLYVTQCAGVGGRPACQ